MRTCRKHGKTYAVGSNGCPDCRREGKGRPWVSFCDRSYYDMWAVRRSGERRWGHCFHVTSKGEATALRDLLCELEEQATNAEVSSK